MDLLTIIATVILFLLIALRKSEHKAEKSFSPNAFTIRQPKIAALVIMTLLSDDTAELWRIYVGFISFALLGVFLAYYYFVMLNRLRYEGLLY